MRFLLCIHPAENTLLRIYSRVGRAFQYIHEYRCGSKEIRASHSSLLLTVQVKVRCACPAQSITMKLLRFKNH